MVPKRFQKVGHQTQLEEENRRLKREQERTRQERDILKCAVVVGESFFMVERLGVKVVSVHSESGLTGYALLLLSALVKGSQSTLHTASDTVLRSVI